MCESEIIQTVCRGCARLGAWSITGLVVANACYETGQKMTALAELADVSAAAITGTIDRLESEGMAVRERQPDRRTVFVRLTEKGRKIVEDLRRDLAALTIANGNALLQA